MPSRFSVRVATFLAAMVLCIGTPRAQALFPPDYANLIRQSDLVVHGLVRDVSRDQVPATDLFPSDPRPDATIAIIILEVEVREVLKGYQTEADLTLVVPAGFSGLRTDYNIGNEVVLSAIYWKYMRGGSYMVTNDGGCFRKSGETWWNQLSIPPDKPVETTIADIKEVIAHCLPDVLLRAAELAAVFRIEDVSRLSQDSPNMVNAASSVVVRAQVTEVVRGDAVGVVTFHSVGGSVQFKAGQEWLVYLARDSSGLYVMDATNGLFRISADSVIQADRVLLPVPRDSFIAFLKSSQ